MNLLLSWDALPRSCVGFFFFRRTITSTFLCFLLLGLRSLFSASIMYDFVSDRYRAVRMDFACQGLEGASSMQAYEQMVRFHALSVYRMLPHTDEGVHILLGAGGQVSKKGHLPGAEGGIWRSNREVQTDPTGDSSASASALSAFTKGARHEARVAVEPYDRVQNVEKLTQSLTTLMKMYEAFYRDLGVVLAQQKNQRVTGGETSPRHRRQLDDEILDGLEDLRPSPNEAEMHSYHILVSLADPKAIPELVAQLPEHVFRAPIVQTAIQAFLCLTQGNWMGWFRLLKRRATFLQACLMHPFFEKIRTDGLRSYSKGFHVSPCVPSSSD